MASPALNRWFHHRGACARPSDAIEASLPVAPKRLAQADGQRRRRGIFVDRMVNDSTSSVGAASSGRVSPLTGLSNHGCPCYKDDAPTGAEDENAASDEAKGRRPSVPGSRFR